MAEIDEELLIDLLMAFRTMLFHLKKACSPHTDYAYREMLLKWGEEIYEEQLSNFWEYINQSEMEGNSNEK
jgi:hypothetical protein